MSEETAELLPGECPSCSLFCCVKGSCCLGIGCPHGPRIERMRTALDAAIRLIERTNARLLHPSLLPHTETLLNELKAARDG